MPQPGNPRILVIENELEIRESVADVLRHEGYLVETFADGQLALDRLKTNPESCLILLDLLMPVMNGWEFMVEFLKLPVTVIPIPVYLYSVKNEVDGETAQMGAQGYIKKPTDLSVLLAIVNGICESSKRMNYDRDHPRPA